MNKDNQFFLIILGQNFYVKLKKSLDFRIFYPPDFAGLWLWPQNFFYLNSVWVYDQLPYLNFHTNAIPFPHFPPPPTC